MVIFIYQMRSRDIQEGNTKMALTTITERHRTKTFYDLRKTRNELNRYRKHREQIIRTTSEAIYNKNISWYEQQLTNLITEWDRIKQPGDRKP